METWGQVFQTLLKKIQNLPTLKKLLLTLSCVSFLATCYWFYYISQFPINTPENTKVVNELMTYLSREEYEKAYTLFADRYKKEEDFETFKNSIIKFKPGYIGYAVNTFRPTKTTRLLLPLDLPTLQYKGTISYADGETEQINTIFIWENDRWRLYILEFNPQSTKFQ